MVFDHRKYRASRPISLTQRRWPDKRIEHAPIWCSVDLRDGNQALIEPMSPETKLALFDLLVDIGFTEIEVGFPAASKADFDFIRLLIEQGRVPDHVTIQVLTQARSEIVSRTFEAVRGAKKVILHLYVPTSPLQRERVLHLTKSDTVRITVDSAIEIRTRASEAKDTAWTFQYAPESFTATEPEFAVEICNNVIDIWQPTPDNRMIITLPATVENATPNIYADQVQWVCDNLARREAIIVGTHTHNDRGCAVAAAELAIMAGAQRVEGTLLGNGERSGNMDIVVMAMNLYSQGVDPLLRLGDMDRLVSVVSRCTKIDVHPRHPYCGELTYTAFSGGHQDAIKKCLQAQDNDRMWEVAYLPINPEDVGRAYQDVIRINSQSGKGGLSYVLETKLGVRPPRWLQIDFSRIVQSYCDECGGEIGTDDIWKLFNDNCLSVPADPELVDIAPLMEPAGSFVAVVRHRGVELKRGGDVLGGGSFVGELAEAIVGTCDVIDWELQPIAATGRVPPQSSQAVKGEFATIGYVRLKCRGEYFGGVAIGESPVEALVRSTLNALGRISSDNGSARVSDPPYPVRVHAA